MTKLARPAADAVKMQSCCRCSRECISLSERPWVDQLTVAQRSAMPPLVAGYIDDDVNTRRPVCPGCKTDDRRADVAD